MSKLLKIINKKLGTSYAIVDDEDYNKLAKYKWSFSKHQTNYYIRSWINKKTIYLHRFLLNPPANLEIDHINHNGLDNRKCNLRIVTHQQNILNKRKQKNNNSGYTGVYFRKDAKKWCSHIQINGKSIHLGFYDNKQQAYQAYLAKNPFHLITS